MITRRHITYIVVNILCQSYNMISKVESNIHLESRKTWWQVPLIILYFGQGVWLNLVRLAEPTFLPTAWFYTKKVLCMRMVNKM